MGVGGGGGGGGGGIVVGVGGGGVGTVVDAEGGDGGVGDSRTDPESAFSVPTEAELTSLSDSSACSLTLNSEEQEIIDKQHKIRSALILSFFLELIF